MSSSWSLLLPHPDPTRFSQGPARASASASAPLPSAASLTAIGVNINMSSTLVRKKNKHRALLPPSVSSSPPKLQPLSFPPEPIVDLTLPPYQPPSEAHHAGGLLAARAHGDTHRAYNDLRQLNSDIDNTTHDDDNDAESGGLVSAQPSRGLAAGTDDDNNTPSHGLARAGFQTSSNQDHHHYALLSPPDSTLTITPSFSNLASNQNHRPGRSPEGYLSVPDVGVVGVSFTSPESAPAYLAQPGLSPRPASRSLTALDTPSHLAATSEQPPLPPLPPHNLDLMSSAAPFPTHVQSDCGHGTTTARFGDPITVSPAQDKPKRRASLFARTFSLRNAAGPKIKNRPILRGLTKLHDATTAYEAIQEDVITQSKPPSNGLQRTRQHLSPSSSPDSGTASGSGSSTNTSGSTAVSGSAHASSSNPVSHSGSSSGGGLTATSQGFNLSMEPAPHAGSASSFNTRPAVKSGQGMTGPGAMTSSAGHIHTHTQAHTQAAEQHHDQRLPTRPALTPHPSSSASTDSHSKSSQSHSHEGAEGEGTSTGSSSPFTTYTPSPSGPSRSASFSASVLTTSSQSFTRWRRWRAGGRMGSGLSSRTSLGEELEKEKEGVFGTGSDDHDTRRKLKRPGQGLTPKGKQKEKDKERPDHSRNSSWGDVAMSLLVKDKDKDKSKGKGKEKEPPSSSSGKKAKFTLGSESDVDLPSSYPNSARSKSPIPPVPPLPHFVSGSTRDLTASPSPTEQQHHPNFVHRPPLLRQNAVISPDEPVGRRRWTLASVMTDEGISDESLVRELERMREVAEWARRREKERKGGTDQAPSDDGDDGEEEMGVVWDFGMDVWEREKEKGGGVLFESPRSESGAATGTGTPDEMNGVAGNNNEKSASFPNLPVPPSTELSTTRRSTAPSPTWLAAQRALLICRELILTERHYLSLLLSLLSQHTATPPPPLMLRYAEELVRASAGVLAGMEREPNVGGVARAFLEREEEVTLAYVSWCGVVGGWFVDHHREGSKAAGHGDGQASGGLSGDPAFTMTPLKRTVSTWRKSMPSIASLGLEGGGMMSIYGKREPEKEKDKDLKDSKEREREKEKDRSKTLLSPPAALGVGVVPVLPPSVSAASVSMSVAVSRSMSGIGLVSSVSASASTLGAVKGHHHPQYQHHHHHHQQRKPPTVRELAILPTQRVMRYVLLYRDLLSHTPHTSPSRTFVERAVEAACRIADKCDRAQGNAAFVASSSSSSANHRDGPKIPRSGASESGHSKSATTSPTSAVFPGSPPSSLSAAGGVLRKKNPKSTEVPVGTTVMGGSAGRVKNVRTVSGVSLKSFSGRGWGKSAKDESVPMVVNLESKPESAEREGATVMSAVAGGKN